MSYIGFVPLPDSDCCFCHWLNSFILCISVSPLISVAVFHLLGLRSVFPSSLSSHLVCTFSPSSDTWPIEAGTQRHSYLARAVLWNDLFRMQLSVNVWNALIGWYNAGTVRGNLSGTLRHCSLAFYLDCSCRTSKRFPGSWHLKVYFPGVWCGLGRANF